MSTSKAVATKAEDKELISQLRAMHYPNASDTSIFMVVGVCQRQELDPMTKPFHIVPMYSKAAGRMVDQVMPGIDYYRMKAHRTKSYAGMSKVKFGPTIEAELSGVKVSYPEWCEVTVKRIVDGEPCSFPAREYWMENYATAKKDTLAPNSMWRKRPFAQLAKCVEAQALRRGFPDVVGAQPTYEEMAGKDLDDGDFIEGTIVPTDADIAQDVAQVAAPSEDDRLAAELAKNFDAGEPEEIEDAEIVEGEPTGSAIEKIIATINNSEDANKALELIKTSTEDDDTKSALKKAVTARMREINKQK